MLNSIRRTAVLLCLTLASTLVLAPASATTEVTPREIAVTFDDQLNANVSITAANIGGRWTPAKYLLDVRSQGAQPIGPLSDALNNSQFTGHPVEVDVSRNNPPTTTAVWGAAQQRDLLQLYVGPRYSFRVGLVTNEPAVQRSIYGSLQCNLRIDGGVDCRGTNRYNELGRTDEQGALVGLNTAASEYAVPIRGIQSTLSWGALGTAKLLAVGKNFACAAVVKRADLREAVACWGRNDFGQTGREPRFATSSGPEQIALPAGMSAVKALVAGEAHACVLATVSGRDEVWCWGRNDFGQLGQLISRQIPDRASTLANHLPMKVPFPAGFITEKLTSGPNTVCATSQLVTNAQGPQPNNVFCWGSVRAIPTANSRTNTWETPQNVLLATNANASTAAAHNEPLAVTGGATQSIKDIVLGTNGGCWVSATRGLECWHTSGVTPNRHLFVSTGATDIAQIAAADEYCYLKTSDSQVYCVGPVAYANRANPWAFRQVDLSGLLPGLNVPKRAYSISGGGGGLCVQLTFGTSNNFGGGCWGSNNSGIASGVHPKAPVNPRPGTGYSVINNGIVYTALANPIQNDATVLPVAWSTVSRSVTAPPSAITEAPYGEFASPAAANSRVRFLLGPRIEVRPNADAFSSVTLAYSADNGATWPVEVQVPLPAGTQRLPRLIETEVPASNLFVPGASYRVRWKAANATAANVWSPISEPIPYVLRPSAAQSIRVTALSPTTARISWTEPNSTGGAAVQYVTTVNELPSGTLVERTSLRQERSIVVSRLRVNNRYSIAVATNNLSADNQNRGSEVATYEYLHSFRIGAPTDLRVISSSGNSVKFGWTAPAASAASVTGYQVAISKGNGKWTLQPPVSTNEATYVGEAGSTYRIRVAAITAGGIGDYSTALPFRTGGSAVPETPGDLSAWNTVPDAPQNVQTVPVIGEQQLQISWTAPDNDGGLPIQSYQVTYSLDGGTTWLTDRVTDPDKTDLVAELTQIPYGQIKVAVQARNATGISERATADVSFIQPPSAPINVTAASHEFPLEDIGRVATIFWDPPRELRGSTIAQYQVFRLRADGAYAIAAQTAQTQVTLRDLVGGQSHSFRVRAITTGGVFGDWSAVAVLGDPLVTPNAPVLVKTVPVENAQTTVALVWQEGAKIGSLPTIRFNVYYTSSLSAVVKKWSESRQTASSGLWTTTIEGLTPNTDYKFYVTAENAVGESRPSPQIAVRTSALPENEEVDILVDNLARAEERDRQAEADAAAAREALAAAEREAAEARERAAREAQQNPGSNQANDAQQNANNAEQAAEQLRREAAIREAEAAAAEAERQAREAELARLAAEQAERDRIEAERRLAEAQQASDAAQQDAANQEANVGNNPAEGFVPIDFEAPPQPGAGDGGAVAGGGGAVVDVVAVQVGGGAAGGGGVVLPQDPDMAVREAAAVQAQREAELAAAREREVAARAAAEAKAKAAAEADAAAEAAAKDAAAKVGVPIVFEPRANVDLKIKVAAVPDLVLALRDAQAIKATLASDVVATTAALRTAFKKAFPKGLKIQFAELSARLTPASVTSIKKLAKLKLQSVRITGYVQKSASTENDISLSRARAQAVASVLRGAGVKRSIIKTIAGGVGGKSKGNRAAIVAIG